MAGPLCFCTGVCPRGVETASSEHTQAPPTGKWAGRGESVGWVLLGGFPPGGAPQKAGLGASPSDAPTTAPAECVCGTNSPAAPISPGRPAEMRASELLAPTRQAGTPFVTPMPGLHVAQRSVVNPDIPEAFPSIALGAATHGITNGPRRIPFSLPAPRFSPWSFRACRGADDLGCASVCEAAVAKRHTLGGQDGRHLSFHSSRG